MNALTSAHAAAMTEFAPSSHNAECCGNAYILQIEPDMTAFERINIGVGVIRNDGVRLVKVLEDFGRIESFYGVHLRDSFELLTQVAKEAFVGGYACGPCIHLIDANSFYNIAPQSYVEQLFAAVVPAAKPRRETRDSDGQRNSEQLRAEVSNIIRIQAPNIADEIIANTPHTNIATRNGIRSVFIPLQPKRGAGAIESVDFSEPTARLKLMTALLDIETAADAKDLKKTGLFIGRPRRGRRQSEMAALDNVIDFVTSRAPSSCRVEVSGEAQTLATSIIEWAEAA